MVEAIFDPTFFNAVHQLVNYMVKVSIYVLTPAVLVYFIAMVLRFATDREGGNYFYHFSVVVFTAIGLASYQIWAVWLGKFFVLVARAIFDLEKGNIMEEYLGAFFGANDGSSLRFSLINLLSLETWSSLSYLLVMIVYEIFVVIQVIVQVFLYALGPLAIVTSLFPQFRDTFKGWLANFCAVNFWSVLVAVLFRLMKIMVYSSGLKEAMASGNKGGLFSSFILGVLTSIVIILIPKIATAIFKGGGLASDLGSYGVGATAAVVTATTWQTIKKMAYATTGTVIAQGANVPNRLIGSAGNVRNELEQATQQLSGGVSGGGGGDVFEPAGSKVQIEE